MPCESSANYRFSAGLVASLRFGELGALQRRRVDADEGYVHVRVAAVELSDGSRLVGPPKTAAGRRAVAIPSALLPDVRRHLAQFTGVAPEALVFAGPKGAAQQLPEVVAHRPGGSWVGGSRVGGRALSRFAAHR